MLQHLYIGPIHSGRFALCSEKINQGLKKEKNSKEVNWDMEQLSVEYE